MAVNSADLHQAVVAAWDANTLDSVFKAYWSVSDQANHIVLHDEEALAGQPFPYCVFHQEPGTTVSKMTKGSNETKGRFEVRDIPWEFRVHARQMTVNGVVTSAKDIAAGLVDYILRAFGGHPTVEAYPDFTLDNGWILQVTYENDYPVREGDKEAACFVKYRFLIDAPVAT